MLINLIKLYQKVHPAFFSGCCRFYPTCSNYAIEALQKYGAAKGIWLTTKRILRCQPFCKGGFDPVP
ncbi:MAG: membrane protein insertion efficiency factor YidD [Fibromonadaceae bacterium]|jgi:putative membrane protein insertion efficiency factor|nr:membrane protein insertion efficiency factor YidD [Fibromonadaceae bacterium]